MRFKAIPWLLIVILCFFASCKKEKDYRDQFTGTYTCDYMKISQTEIILPDTIIYYYDTSYSFNDLFAVTKAEDPHKLVILDVEIEVHNDGSLENYWVPGRGITGNFYDNDSIYIRQGIGKMDGYTEYWRGKK